MSNKKIFRIKTRMRSLLFFWLSLLIATLLLSPVPAQALGDPNMQLLISPNPAPNTQTPGEHHALIIGFCDGSFRPMDTITRAQAATIIFRFMSDEDRETYWKQQNAFTDVEINHWYNTAVSTATNAGLIAGMPDGSFQPNRQITRAEFTAILTGLATTPYCHPGLKDREPMRFLDQGEYYYNMPLFSDIHGHWAEDAINMAASRGWIAGYEGLGGKFLPDQAITRAEAAAIICRAHGRRPVGTGTMIPSIRTFTDNTDPNAWYYLYVLEAAN